MIGIMHWILVRRLGLPSPSLHRFRHSRPRLMGDLAHLRIVCQIVYQIAEITPRNRRKEMGLSLAGTDWAISESFTSLPLSAINKSRLEL